MAGRHIIVRISELPLQLFPRLTAIGSSEHLTEIGAAKKKHGIGRVGGHPPNRAVDRPGQPGILPALPHYLGCARGDRRNLAAHSHW